MPVTRTISALAAAGTVFAGQMVALNVPLGVRQLRLVLFVPLFRRPGPGLGRADGGGAAVRGGKGQHGTRTSHPPRLSGRPFDPACRGGPRRVAAMTLLESL